jgi:hypothetical protein
MEKKECRRCEGYEAKIAKLMGQMRKTVKLTAQNRPIYVQEGEDNGFFQKTESYEKISDFFADHKLPLRYPVESNSITPVGWIYW